MLFFSFTKRKKKGKLYRSYKTRNITKTHKNREVQQRADHIYTRGM